MKDYYYMIQTKKRTSIEVLIKIEKIFYTIEVIKPLVTVMVFPSAEVNVPDAP
jgi:hypothetical protein